MPTVAIEDSTLELMTQSLLQISSVFLVQQNELQEVRDRLQKELSRVSLIQETLSNAAQQHQDAVLSVIQNYENLAPESEAAASSKAAASLDSRLSQASVASSAADESAPPKIPLKRKSMRQVHLPPVVTEVTTFKEKPKESLDDEDEGIQYVENLQARRSRGALSRPGGWRVLRASGVMVARAGAAVPRCGGGSGSAHPEARTKPYPRTGRRRRRAASGPRRAPRGLT